MKSVLAKRRGTQPHSLGPQSKRRRPPQFWCFVTVVRAKSRTMQLWVRHYGCLRKGVHGKYWYLISTWKRHGSSMRTGGLSFELHNPPLAEGHMESRLLKSPFSRSAGLDSSFYSWLRRCCSILIVRLTRWNDGDRVSTRLGESFVYGNVSHLQSRCSHPICL